MDIGSIFVLLGIFLLSVLFIIRPFWKEDGREQPGVRHRYSHLVAEKERFLSAIHDLDLEMELKKISAEDHQNQRAILVREAAIVLEKLDEMPDPDPGSGKPADEPGGADELESLIASRREELQGKASGFCPNCGHSVMSTDQFCGHCGEKIQR